MTAKKTDLILSELSALFEGVSSDLTERTAAALSRYDRVFFYAAGRSGLMLRALAMRLAQMGRCVYVVGETTTPAIKEGDLMVVASASGSTQSVRFYAETALQAGAQLFVITGRANSALTALHPADVLLVAPNKNSTDGSAQVMGSLFEQALLLFSDAVVSCMPADAADMRLRHANLE